MGDLSQWLSARRPSTQSISDHPSLPKTRQLRTKSPPYTAYGSRRFVDPPTRLGRPTIVHPSTDFERAEIHLAKLVMV